MSDSILDEMDRPGNKIAIVTGASSGLGKEFVRWIKTNLYARADIGASKATRKFAGMVMPEKVASKALKDAQRGKDVSVYGFYAKLVHIISRLFSQRMMMKIWLWQQHM